jgi:hypothetical protein
MEQPTRFIGMELFKMAKVASAAPPMDFAKGYQDWPSGCAQPGHYKCQAMPLVHSRSEGSLYGGIMSRKVHLAKSERSATPVTISPSLVMASS